MSKQPQIPESKRLFDGFLDAVGTNSIGGLSVGGVNTDLDPFLLQPTQLSNAENVTLRGGFPASRPGFIRHLLTFSDSGLRDWWASRVWQGAATYNASQSDNFHLVIVGGRLFKVDPANAYSVSEVTPQQQTPTVAASISPPVGGSVSWLVADASDILIGLPVTILDGQYMVTGKLNNLVTFQNLSAIAGVAVPIGTPVIYLEPNPSTMPQTWFEQAEEFMIVQDGQSPPIIFDGNTARRAGGDEVLVGKMMKYHRRRLWVARNKNLVTAGDIAAIGNDANLLKFTEYLVIQGGGSIRVDGEITAMVTMPALDASLGQGPLQVITENGFTSINLPTNRDVWGTSQFETVSLENAGATGQYSVVVVNGDPWYRATDGLRSFIVARRYFGMPSNTSMSVEMRKVMDDDTQDLLQYCSAVLFDKRLLFTVRPRRLHFNAYWNGIVSLDFNPQSSMAVKRPPIFDGQWTGIHPYQLLTGKFQGRDRCFAYTNEPDGIGLWEISKNEPFDGDGGRISSWLEYPALKFQTPMRRKKLQGTKIWVADVIGIVDYILRFRPDDAACWIYWNTKQVCAKAKSCATDSCALQTFEAGYKPHMGFGLPPDTCEEFNNSLARFAYSWQYRLEWVGHSMIKRLLSTADEMNDQVMGDEDSDDR